MVISEGRGISVIPDDGPIQPCKPKPLRTEACGREGRRRVPEREEEGVSKAVVFCD